jgi:hypothetical protein
MGAGETVLDRYAAIYKKLARHLKRALPKGWSKAWIWAEMSERYGSIVVYYVDDAGKIGWIAPPLALYDRFRELNNAARRGGLIFVWTSATFSLERDGTFSIDFGYDPIPIEEEDERRDAWKLRYLPQA